MGTRSDNLPNGLYRDDDGSIGLIICPKCQRDILVREDWLKAYSAMDYDKFIAAVKTGAKQELPTCRTCKHCQRWELNDHSTKIVQSCALQKSRRTGNGLKRIKVNNPACALYEKE